MKVIEFQFLHSELHLHKLFLTEFTPACCTWNISIDYNSILMNQI